MGIVQLKRYKMLRLALLLLLIFSILCSGPAVFAEGTAAAGDSQSRITEYKEFLKDQYNIVLPDTVTKEHFVKAIEQISGAKYGEIDKNAGVAGMDKALNNSEALSIAVKAAGIKELAYTYPKEKLQSTLQKIGVDYSTLKDVSLQRAQEIAAAVDCGLLNKAVKLDAAVTRDDAAFLLGKGYPSRESIRTLSVMSMMKIFTAGYIVPGMQKALLKRRI